MSVPVNARTHGKLEACMKAHDLCVYTLRITSNENIFVPQHASFRARIDDAAISIHSKAWAANNIYVGTDEESFKERRKLQQESANLCNVLLSYIDIAKNLYHLDTKRVKYWSCQVIEVRNLIRAWRDSDLKRFKSGCKL